MKKMKEIEVYNVEGDDFPTKPSEFILYFQNLLNKVPEEFRDSSKIELMGFDNYGCEDIRTVISYERIETDKEEEVREEVREENLKARVAAQENWDRKKLAELKDKYER